MPRHPCFSRRTAGLPGHGRRGSPPSGRRKAPVIWTDARPAPRPPRSSTPSWATWRETWSRCSTPSPRPRRPGPTSAWCPSSPSPATRPRTSSSSPASWPTTWPPSRRWRRPPVTAPSWSGSWRPRPADRGWPTPPPSAPGAGWPACTASSAFPTTACSTSSATSRPGPSRRRSSQVAGAWVGVSICEDVWFEDGPVAHAGRAGADVVVNLNASPYNRGRRRERLAMLEAAGGRGRLRHRLCQPGRRPGRARLRRRLARHRGRRHPGRLGRAVRRPTSSSSTCRSGRGAPGR